ncbi:MAG: hypothetical protein RL385_2620 [Pseudomonadota bacterium]|jgi:hypothetical protein
MIESDDLREPSGSTTLELADRAGVLLRGPAQANSDFYPWQRCLARGHLARLLSAETRTQTNGECP